MPMNFKGFWMLAAMFAVALRVAGCKTTDTPKSGRASTQPEKADDPAFKGD